MSRKNIVQRNCPTVEFCLSQNARFPVSCPRKWTLEDMRAVSAKTICYKLQSSRVITWNARASSKRRYNNEYQLLPIDPRYKIVL